MHPALHLLPRTCFNSWLCRDGSTYADRIRPRRTGNGMGVVCDPYPARETVDTPEGGGPGLRNGSIDLRRAGTGADQPGGFLHGRDPDRLAGVSACTVATSEHPILRGNPGDARNGAETETVYHGRAGCGAGIGVAVCRTRHDRGDAWGTKRSHGVTMDSSSSY